MRFGESDVERFGIQAAVFHRFDFQLGRIELQRDGRLRKRQRRIKLQVHRQRLAQLLARLRRAQGQIRHARHRLLSAHAGRSRIESALADNAAVFVAWVAGPQRRGRNDLPRRERLRHELFYFLLRFRGLYLPLFRHLKFSLLPRFLNAFRHRRRAYRGARNFRLLRRECFFAVLALAVLISFGICAFYRSGLFGGSGSGSGFGICRHLLRLPRPFGGGGGFRTKRLSPPGNRPTRLADHFDFSRSCTRLAFAHCRRFALHHNRIIVHRLDNRRITTRRAIQSAIGRPIG